MQFSSSDSDEDYSSSLSEGSCIFVEFVAAVKAMNYAPRFDAKDEEQWGQVYESIQQLVNQYFEPEPEYMELSEVSSE